MTLMVVVVLTLVACGGVWQRRRGDDNVLRVDNYDDH